MKSEQESEQYSYTCKLCGDSYQHKKKKQSRTQCNSCKERQDWGNAATEPKWWPRFIPTKDNGRSKNIRWTNYALSSFFLVLTILILAALGVGSEIGSGGSSWLITQTLDPLLKDAEFLTKLQLCMLTSANETSYLFVFDSGCTSW